jgi:serine/threonine-protein kinase
MTSSRTPLSDPSRDDALDEVLGEYLSQAEAVAGDADALRALQEACEKAHPGLALRLRRHFESEDLVGSRLAGGRRAAPSFQRYSQLTRIGEGAMGAVYKAFDQSLKRWVALKVPALDQDPPSERRRIRSEAESMAQLEHRHIVRVFDVSDEGSDTVISMELIAGGSLQEHLSTFVRDPSGTARLMVALARGVHHAHQRGILHRDLKPSNVLLGRDEDGTFHPYVSDFGLAKPIPVTAPPHQPGPGPETVAYGRIVGTASYMSCEQAAGSPATTLSDVYGLGGILYAMLTGRPPFRGETAAERFFG